MSVGISTFQTLFQTYYPESDLPYLVPDNLPLLNMIPKEGGLSGDVIDMPFLYGAKQGVSQSFDAAAAQSGGSPNSVRPTVRCSQMYDIVEFLDKDWVLSQGEAAYADLFQKTMTGAMMAFNNEMDLLLHAEGNGVRGQVSSVSTNVITLTSTGSYALPLETTFEVGMQVQPATSAPVDGSVPAGLGSPVTITNVDGDARTITVSDGSVFDSTTNKYIVVRGNGIGFSASNTNGALIGLGAFNPYTAPSASENFLGIDRTRYTTRLAGYRYDGSSRSIEDAIKRLAAKMSMGGVKSASVALVNPLDWDSLDSKLGSNVRYSSVQSVTYGFDSIVLNTAAGRLDVVSDPHQQLGYCRVLDPSALVLRHALTLPHLADIQGRTQEQGANFDGRTVRLRAYMQLCLKDPRKLGIVKLPQISA
jgi:hypothetical protein